MNKILLVPGSFNPITNAHIDMALAAKKAVNADTVLFIPAHDTYVAKKKILIPGYCRVSLINSMPNCGKDNVWASEIETIKFFPPKTYNTISELKDNDRKNNIRNVYYICLGMDNVEELKTWYKWDKLITENNFVACSRNGKNLRDTLDKIGLLGFNNRFVEVHIPENNISSSLVRELCGKGEFEKVKELVPKNVYEYLIRFYDAIN